jgi:hypothetical protein
MATKNNTKYIINIEVQKQESAKSRTKKRHNSRENSTSL